MKGTILSLIIFTALSFILPFYGPTEEINMIFTVTSFLFGIIAAFFIADRHSRFERMRELIAEENGGLTGVYEIAKLLDRKFAAKVADLIDRYIIEGFDYELWKYQEKISRQFFKLFDSLKKAKVDTKKEIEEFNVMLTKLEEVTTARKEIFMVGKDRMMNFQWFVLLILSFIAVFCLFYSRTMASVSSMIFAVLLSTVVVMVMLILRDMDSLRWREEAVGFEAFARVFDAIGRPRYYPEWALNRIRIPEDKDHRVGIYKDYPASNEKTIKLVKAKRKKRGD
jgi:membrane protein YdbS with pleckstrin-like domain